MTLPFSLWWLFFAILLILISASAIGSILALRYGLAYLPEQLVTEGLAQGKLISVLEEKCITLPPYYIYYPTRLQTSVGFSKLLETLKI